jgi:hypothetical protein
MMAIRFRKSLKLAPGVRMNLSGSGVSWTLGPRGASIGIGKRGSFLNAGIAGSGLSTRQSLASSRPAKQKVAPTEKVSLTVSVEDDGQILFLDETGKQVSEALISQAKKQHGDHIRGLIQSKCDEINGQVSALAEIHLDAPDPKKPLTYQMGSFDLPEPRSPTPKAPGILSGLFKKKRQQVEAENAEAESIYQNNLAAWKEQRELFGEQELRKSKLVSATVVGDIEAMEELFGEVLMDIVWPRETEVSFEVRDKGGRLIFDVDLPEIQDMPTKTATVPQRGYKLSIKEMGQTAVQKLYANHLHSIVFRLLAEAFAMLPTVQTVVLSGFSQRKDRATGQLGDEYLLSVSVQREQWEHINFLSLDAVDVTEALALFDLRRDMTKTGVFKVIQPLS